MRLVPLERRSVARALLARRSVADRGAHRNRTTAPRLRLLCLPIGAFPPRLAVHASAIESVRCAMVAGTTGQRALHLTCVCSVLRSEGIEKHCGYHRPVYYSWVLEQERPSAKPHRRACPFAHRRWRANHFCDESPQPGSAFAVASGLSACGARRGQATIGAPRASMGWVSPRRAPPSAALLFALACAG